MMVTGATDETGNISPVVRTDKFNIDTITESMYVEGMRKQEGYKILDVMLPDGWEIPKRIFEGTDINVNIKEDGRTVDVGYMFFSPTASFSDIYIKLIDVVTYNVELEEKLVIFNRLQKQLQDALDAYNLADFKQLKLVLPKTSPVKPIKPDENAVKP
jgi:hypothetical protein